MSYKHTYLAWQAHNVSAEEKLVLLKLSDIASADGQASFVLRDITQECLCEEFKLSSILFALSQKGLLAMGRTTREGSVERHSCQLTLDSDSQSAPQPSVQQAAPMTEKPSITTLEGAGLPQWANKTCDFYKVPASYRDDVWREFIRQNGRGNVNISRLERNFENWLEESKRTGRLEKLTSNHQAEEPAAPNSYRSVESSSRPNNGYLNSYDLDENTIPSWAERELHHSALDMDLRVFWKEFVLYQKTQANFIGPVTQFVNKLRYSINLKKQWMEKDRQKQARYQQHSSARDKHVSPSEEFRQFLREQGKKPSF
ncbi:hypothetical protein M0357_000048 [Vibrio harveyi]|uniref:hypothetical protein n=1 Tax=Vibrio harveyi TaxID=669 RepID=UPI00298384BA|nr:hypothetical protein [Vibrio harveyi]HDM8131038.1 hypothetical protein [Vibrio harveyi]